MRHLSFVLLFVLAAPAAIACTGGSTVRVRFYNCPVGDTVYVRVGNEPIALTRKGDVYEGQLTNGQINTAFPIEVAGRPPICCKLAKLVPKERRSQDCAVEYVVSCDVRAPAWALAAHSDAGVTFDFTSEHPDDFGTAACYPTLVQRTPTAASNLGLYDIVDVKVYREGMRLVTFPVSLQNLTTGQLPMSRVDLEKMIDDEAASSRLSSSGPARALIDRRKTLLPENGVTVVKQ